MLHSPKKRLTGRPREKRKRRKRRRRQRKEKTASSLSNENGKTHWFRRALLRG
jgi:hypothetical protein